MPRLEYISNMEYTTAPPSLMAGRQQHQPPPKLAAQAPSLSSSCSNENENKNENNDASPPYTATSMINSAVAANAAPANNGSTSTDEYETDDNSDDDDNSNDDDKRRGQKRKNSNGGGHEPKEERGKSDEEKETEEEDREPHNNNNNLNTSDDLSFHTANSANNNDDDDDDDDEQQLNNSNTNDNEKLYTGEHDDECYICNEGGELICCDYCAKVYHFDCHIPEVVDIDDMDSNTLWKCMNCCSSKQDNSGCSSSSNNNSAATMANKIIVLDDSNNDDNDDDDDVDDVVKYHKSPTKRQKVIDDDDDDNGTVANNGENGEKILDDNDKVGDNNHGIIPMAQDAAQTNQNNNRNEIVIEGVVIMDVQRPAIDDNNNDNNNNNNNTENAIVHKDYKANEKNDTEIVNNDDDDVVVIDRPNVWTERDKKLFEIGCVLHGWGNWVAIHELLPTKTILQVITHSQARQQDKAWLQSERNQQTLQWHVQNIHKIVADLIAAQLKLLSSINKQNSRKDDIDFLYFLQTKIPIISSLPPKTMKDIMLLGIIDRRIIVGNGNPVQSMYPTLMSLWSSPSSGAYWTFSATTAMVDRINGYTGTIELRRFIQDKFAPNPTVHVPAPVPHIANNSNEPPKKTVNHLQIRPPMIHNGTTALAPAPPHIANNSNEPPKKSVNHLQIRPPVQSTAHSSNKTGNNKTTRADNTAGSTVGEKANNTTSHHNHSQSKPFTSGLPFRERFSEYQIDNASSITELESIRRRLLTLLDRTETRLRGMRVADALSITFGKDSVEALSTEELITKLVGGEKGSNNDSTTETAADEETSTHEEHIPVTCPLCFEKIATSPSSSSIVTCHICEADGMCNNCYEQCTSCHLATCADCLMSCDGCASNYHCSDCMGIGNGKCVSCRKNSSKGLPTKNASTKQQGSKKIDKSTKNAVSSLSRGNQMLASERNTQHQQPPLNQQPLSRTQEEMEATSERVRSAAGYVVPGANAHHLAEKSATIGPLSTDPPSVNNASTMAIQRTQVAAVSKPRATHPLVEPTTTIAPTHKTSKTVAEFFSIHRFLISDAGTIGMNLTLLQSSKKCIISTVHANSIAVNHGIEEGDEILPSHDNDDIYRRFINTSNQRPLMFEVKRLYKHPVRLIARSSGAPVPHSLHRFIITTSGPLGVTIEKGDSMILLKNIAPMSVAGIHGLQNDDILCIPNKKGQLQQRSSLFVDAVKGGIRPLIIEVWRAVPLIVPPSATLSVLPTMKPTTGEENVSNGVSKGTTTTEVDDSTHADLQQNIAEKENNCIDDEDDATLPVSQMRQSLAPNASSNVYAPHAADHALQAVEEKQYQQYPTSIEEKHATRYDYGDRYSEQNIRARKNSDGTVKAATAPKILPDGTFAKPAGRQRKGMDWDAIKGCWYPIKNAGRPRSSPGRAQATMDANNGTHTTLQKDDVEKEVEKEIICIDDDDVDDNVSVTVSNWVCDVCQLEFVTFDEAAACEKKHIQEN